LTLVAERGLAKGERIGVNGVNDHRKGTPDLRRILHAETQLVMNLDPTAAMGGGPMFLLLHRQEAANRFPSPPNAVARMGLQRYLVSSALCRLPAEGAAGVTHGSAKKLSKNFARL
jgi:hypothetical protein